MPIYEYQCGSCQHEFDALQKLSDDPLVDCPACAQPALVKKISAAGFRLKGSGWYETDFKSSNRKNLAGDGGDSKASGDSKKPDSKKSETTASSGSSTAA